MSEQKTDKVEEVPRQMSNTIRKLSKPEDIWPSVKVQKSDIQEAIDYATISLPWTFDRLRYGPKTLQKGINKRLLHILTGVLNQTILERVLTNKGYKCSADWTKYRESDVFDFTINGKTYDVKTVTIYTQYNDSWQRKKFSTKLLIANKNYGGPEWRHFFPMMVPMSQLTIEKMKDSYIFGMAETYEDLMKRKPKTSDQGFWCAAPYGQARDFFHTTGLIREREKVAKGFKIRASWRCKQTSLFGDKRKATLILFGEWDGDRQTESLELIEGKTVLSQNVFSSLSCVRFDHPAILNDYDEILITVKNSFTDFFAKTTNPSINLNDSQFEWVLRQSSFVNLQVPVDYEVYWIGYISFPEYAKLFTSYESYFIPYGNNMNVNQLGRVNARAREGLESKDRRRQKAIVQGIKVPWPEFLSLIDKKNHIKAGLMLAANRGGKPIGAACYFYPPYALLESAIYILPGDLYPMDSLPKE
jgi:hypothetical protein